MNFTGIVDCLEEFFSCLFGAKLPDLGTAAVVLVFYGGMLGAVAPARDGSSWEAHLFGLLVGGGLAWVL